MRSTRGTMQVVVVEKLECGAEGGSRTRTSFRTTDFKSAASAIPPPRHVVRNPNSNKTLLFPVSRGAYSHWLDAWKMRDSFIGLSSKFDYLTEWFVSLSTAAQD